MRLATVIGRVTLSQRHPALKGERLLVVLPWSAKTPQTGRDFDYSIVVYDQLGANGGDIVGVCESLATGIIDPLVGGGTRDIVASVIIVITLLIRPYGLFGREQIERV